MVIDFTRWFLALFFVGVAAFYTARIVMLKRRMAASPVFPGVPGSLHFTTHMAFRVFRILILGVCVARLPAPMIDRFLFTFDDLWHPAVLVAGSCLLLASFASIILIHFYMGDSWRSGTRAEDRTHLITSGPFAVSRNPMMMCVLLGQLGLFLALPTLFTLVCLGLGVWAVLSQVRVEEKLLQQRFGDAYTAYKARTPRWLIFR